MGSRGEAAQRGACACCCCKHGLNFLKKKNHKNQKVRMVGNIRRGLALAAPPFLAILLYCNTLNHRFVYDDRPAVVSNPLVTGSAPLSSLLTSDFWGVPLSHTGSHKSYRPLTSLSFRLDWILAPGSPSQFHLTNLLLHALVSHLFHTFLLSLLPSSPTALTAALLFAAHPIHTEVVAGVVGW